MVSRGWVQQPSGWHLPHNCNPYNYSVWTYSKGTKIVFEKEIMTFSDIVSELYCSQEKEIFFSIFHSHKILQQMPASRETQVVATQRYALGPSWCLWNRLLVFLSPNNFHVLRFLDIDTFHQSEYSLPGESAIIELIPTPNALYIKRGNLLIVYE